MEYHSCFNNKIIMEDLQMKITSNAVFDYPPTNENWSFDFSNELSLDEFAVPHGFEKIADGVLNIEENFPISKRAFINGPSFDKKLVDFIPVAGREYDFKKHKGHVYAISFNGKIVKLGMTADTIQGRIGSYNCGTRAARNKGTCSTTNYHIVESIYGAILNNIKVEIYSYPVINPVVPISIWGDTVSAEVPEVAKFFEKSILRKYKEITGSYPWLSNNG